MREHLLQRPRPVRAAGRENLPLGSYLDVSAASIRIETTTTASASSSATVTVTVDDDHHDQPVVDAYVSALAYRCAVPAGTYGDAVDRQSYVLQRPVRRGRLPPRGVNVACGAPVWR